MPGQWHPPRWLPRVHSFPFTSQLTKDSKCKSDINSPLLNPQWLPTALEVKARPPPWPLPCRVWPLTTSCTLCSSHTGLAAPAAFHAANSPRTLAYAVPWARKATRPGLHYPIICIHSKTGDSSSFPIYRCVRDSLICPLRAVSELSYFISPEPSTGLAQTNLSNGMKEWVK